LQQLLQTHFDAMITTLSKVHPIRFVDVSSSGRICVYIST